MVQPATADQKGYIPIEYNRFEKWFNPQPAFGSPAPAHQYNRFEKWFNPQRSGAVPNA